MTISWKRVAEKLSFLSVVGERGFWLFKKIIYWPRKGEIIFISELSGAVAVYRSENPAAELRKQGLKAGVLSRKDPWLFKKIAKAGGIVLSRVTWQPWGQKIIEFARKNSLPVVVDFDDLTFDVNGLQQTSVYQQASPVKRQALLNRSGKEFLSCPEIKIFTTSTTFLQKELTMAKKSVFVVKNKLSSKEWQWARKLYHLRHQQKKYLPSEVRIGYLSGSLSHDRDLATILPVLGEILKENKTAKLYIVGYISADNKFYREFRRQIIRLPFGSRWRYYQNLAKIDINLAPLEDTNFCRAKSEIKFIEAGALGVPTIAKKNQTFQEVIIDGKNGLLADSPQEWREKMEFLVKNRRERQKIGEKARATVREKYLVSAANSLADEKKYYQWWQQNLKSTKKNYPKEPVE